MFDGNIIIHCVMRLMPLDEYIYIICYLVKSHSWPNIHELLRLHCEPPKTVCTILLRTHLPSVQQMLSATQWPWVAPWPRPWPPMWHASPRTLQGTGLMFSRRHTSVSGVPIRQPMIGPQQMFGPTHWPAPLGPQDMHCKEHSAYRVRFLPLPCLYTGVMEV